MKKNVIFIMADSWQFNYTGCYGNDWIKTPNIDRLAKEGTLFENAYAEGLPTIPCRRAMMTGRYTLPVKGWGPLEMDDTTVADMLWGRDINTCLIYDSAPMQMPKYGYSRGFNQVIFRRGHELDHTFHSGNKLLHLNVEDYIKECNLDDVNPEQKAINELVLNEIREFLKLRQYWKSDEDSYIGVLAKTAINWLEKVDKTHPFLLWFDSFDPHEPWDPPSVWDPALKCPYDPDYKGKDYFIPILGMVDDWYTDEEAHHIRMLYAEKITLVDKWIGKILDKVRDLGLWEDTMIIFCSDHGEPLGKGEHGHGIMRKCRPWPYEELAHIPLIVRVPGVGEGERVSSFAQSVDITPTIMDYLDVGGDVLTSSLQELRAPGTERIQGHSLIPLCSGEKEKVRDFAIAGYFGMSWSIIRDDYSFIHWVRGFEETANMENVGKGYDGSGIVAGAIEKEFRAEFEDRAEKEGMWTCTLGGKVQVPADDELYDRKTDPFQLNNIADKQPDKAEELFRQLRQYMIELRAT